MRLEHPGTQRWQEDHRHHRGRLRGLNAAKRLANAPGVHVVLVDRRNHHLFQPLLYQVATAGTQSGRHRCADPCSVQTRVERRGSSGPVEEVDLQRQILCGGGHEMPYDYLILACGARHSYFGRGDWEQFAPGPKTVEQATEIRRRILASFELAENELGADRQKTFLTFVVVGGGPTGVQLSGAIADISRTALRDDFRRINPAQARVVLVEAGRRILASFPEALSERATRDLAELGVEVRTGTGVDGIDADGVTLGSEKLLANSVFWAAGVQAAQLKVTPNVETDRAGRIKVERDFSIPTHPNVFVVGDLASFEIAPQVTLPGWRRLPSRVDGTRRR